MQKIWDLVKSSQEPSIFTPIHDSHYRTAYNMYKDKPFLGHGPKMFRVICNDKKYAVGKYSCATHPHNFYIQLLAETGILGFLFLLSALRKCYTRSHSELGSQAFQRQWYFVLRHGRVGHCQAYLK